MRVLMLNGSPHRGNTWKLASLLREEMLALDADIAFEEIHLAEIGLPFCAGCSLCFRSGHAKCPHHVQIEPVLEAIERCDGVIVASSCYQMNVTGTMKNFTDHLCFLLHRPRFFDKKAIAVSTTGGVGARGATKFLAGALRGWGFNRCEEMAVSALSWNDYQPTARQREKAKRLAGGFYRDVASGKLHAPKFGVLIPFNLFRGMRFDYAPGKAYATEDGVYWQKMGLEKAVYAPGVPLGIFRRAFGSMFYRMGKVASKHMIVTYRK